MGYDLGGLSPFSDSVLDQELKMMMMMMIHLWDGGAIVSECFRHRCHASAQINMSEVEKKAVGPLQWMFTLKLDRCQAQSMFSGWWFQTVCM